MQLVKALALFSVAVFFIGCMADPVDIDTPSPGSSSSSSTSSSSSSSSSASSSSSSSGLVERQTEVIWAINVGGERFTASDGQIFLADQNFFSGGMTASTNDPIRDTDDDALYQSERWGQYRYELPMANGAVDVLLKFNEQFHTNANSRRFTIMLEGVGVDTVDIFAAAGHDSAYDLSFSNVQVNDGSLTISFEVLTDQASLSGILVTHEVDVPVSASSSSGGNTNSSSGGNNGASSSSSSSSSGNTSSGAGGAFDITAGKTLYEQNCLECHGPTGLGIGAFPKIKVENFTQTILSTYITTNMPRGTGPSSGNVYDPTHCIDECASNVAAYILSGFPNTSGGGNTNIGFQGCSNPEGVPGTRALRQLTRYEYSNTVSDLFNISLNALTINFPQESRVHGFTNNADTAFVSSRHLDVYYDAAVRVAEAATDGAAFNGITAPTGINCNGGLQCVNRFMEIFGLRIFRRPLTDDEKTRYLDVFRAGIGNFDNADNFRRAIRQGITAMLMSPSFLYRSELGEPDNGVYKLNDYEMASLLSYSFTGSTPDIPLMIRAENGQLKTKRDFMREAQRLLDTDKGKAHMGHFASMWWSADLELIGGKNEALYPGYSSDVIQSMVQELENFFIEVAFHSTGKFQELYTADFSMLNDTMSRYYGLGAGTTAFRRTDTANRGGILTLGAVMARNANTEESSPVKRGIFVREQLLCDELPPIPRDVNIAAPDLDPSKPVRERFEAHSVNAVCFNCHQFIDDIGYSLENFDAAGRHREDENGLMIRTDGIVRSIDLQNDEFAIADRHDLATLMANADSTKACMSTQYYRFVTGYSEKQADSCAISNLNKIFADNAFDIKSLLLGITQLDSFSLRK